MKVSIILLAAMLYSSIGHSVETLKVNSAKSEITWRAEKKVGAKHFGTIKISPDQKLQFDKGLPISGEILIDMNSIFVKDLEKGSTMHKKLMDHLRSKDFFKVTEFKHSKLKILGSKKVSDNKIELSTELTILKEKRPLKITADLNQKGDAWEATSKFEIDRKLWKLKYGAGFFKSKLDGIIHDIIKFEIKIIAAK